MLRLEGHSRFLRGHDRQKIRRTAEKSLGAAFDIKRFHDAVLGSGAMPLPILDRHVRETLGVGEGAAA